MGIKTIDQVRRENLDALLAEAKGNQAAMGRRIGKSAKQLNQWFGKGSARNISAATCREIETAWPKPDGWMDTDHGQGERSRASQVTRQFLERVRDAERLLSKTVEIMHATPSESETLDWLEEALHLIEDDSRPFDTAVLLDLSPKLSARIKQRERQADGDDRGQATGTGSKAGGSAKK